MATCARGRRDRRAPRLWLDQRRGVDLRAADRGGALRPGRTLNRPTLFKGADMLVQPYLSFDGRCEEAIEFYRKALGAETTMLMRFKESPEPPPPGMVPPGSENKIMHASLRIGDTIVMASDGACQGNPGF